MALFRVVRRHFKAPHRLSCQSKYFFSPQCMAKRVAIIWLWSGGKSLPNHKTSNGTSFLNPGILSVKFGKFWRITSCLWRKGMRSSRAFVVLKRAFGAEIANDLSTNPRLVLHHLQVLAGKHKRNRKCLFTFIKHTTAYKYWYNILALKRQKQKI